MERIFNRSIKVGGDDRLVDNTSYQVFLTDRDDKFLYVKGTTIPSGKTNYEKGCIFVKTDGTADSSVYINIGDSSSCSFALVENLSAQGAVQTAKVTIANADVKKLKGTPYTLVAAPGAGKMIEFLSATLVHDYATAAFQESADNLAIRFTNGSGAIVSDTIETTGWLDQTADTATSAILKKDAIVATASAINKALVLHNTGDDEFATGGGAIVAYVRYRVLTL